MQTASEIIDGIINGLGDWRGKTLAKARKIIHDADPEIVEEVKWMGTPSSPTPVSSAQERHTRKSSS